MMFPPDFDPKNTPGLSFADLRAASSQRAVQWKSGNVPLLFRVIELCGEAGEVANAAKKLERTTLGLVGGTTDTANLIDELGDVVICADLIAQHLGVDLGEAVKNKFNSTSRKYGFVQIP